MFFISLCVWASFFSPLFTFIDEIKNREKITIIIYPKIDKCNFINIKFCNKKKNEYSTELLSF